MKVKTLFVEDESRGVQPYFRALTEKGFECILAKNGDEAVDLLVNDHFDLVSMDVMFPAGKNLGDSTPSIKSGLKFLEMIRQGLIKKEISNIDVIVLTAVSDAQIEAQIEQLGVTVYLKKPITFQKVIEAFCKLKNVPL
jgi:CheY-like chemotaxis protein